MPRKTARAIIVHDGKVLLMERWRHDAKTGKELHYFSIPGGGIEPKESPEVAVVRELFEEMQVVIRPREVVLQEIDDRGDHHTFFVADYLSGAPKLGPRSPERARAKASNRYAPHWIDKTTFAKLPLNEIYESVRPIIAKLLA